MKIPAPPVEGTTWLHSDLSDWEALRGHVTVVVFWALGDEASLARLSQVQKLTEKYPSLVAIGVHTPRLAYEDELDNLKSVVQQLQITLPIVHDPDFTTWNRYNPEGWPTTFLISDRRTVVGAQPGVDYFDTLEEAIWLSIHVAKNRQTNEPSSLQIDSGPEPIDPENPLSFPSCIRATADNEVALVDSTHNRIVFVELDESRSTGRVTGIADGFSRPGSVAVAQGDESETQVFVSEPGTGSILRHDRATGERFLLAEGLIRPTGLAIDRDDSLVVAESAAQQILRIENPRDSGNTSFGPIASSHSDDEESQLAQPTALVRTEVGLVFCDAATSSLCLLTDRGKVTTIVGEAYEWGLVDGPAHQAKLQRPTDLAVMADGSLLIADTGNNRLRRLSKRRLKTVGPAGLSRPESVCVLPSGHILVADTGNRRIVVLDANFQNPRALEISGLEAPTLEEPVTPTPVKADAISQPYSGESGEKIKVRYPSPGTGPWNVTVHAEPPHLLTEPAHAIRNSSVGKVVARLGTAGNGSLVVRSSLVRDSTVNQESSSPLTVDEPGETVQPSGENLPTSAPQ